MNYRRHLGLFLILSSVANWSLAINTPWETLQTSTPFSPPPITAPVDLAELAGQVNRASYSELRRAQAMQLYGQGVRYDFLHSRAVHLSQLYFLLDHVKPWRLTNWSKVEEAAANALDELQATKGFTEKAAELLPKANNSVDEQLRFAKAIIYLRPQGSEYFHALGEIVSSGKPEAALAAVRAIKELAIEYRIAPDSTVVNAFVHVLNEQPALPPREIASNTPMVTVTEVKWEVVGTLMLFNEYNDPKSPLFQTDFSFSKTDQARLMEGLTALLDEQDPRLTEYTLKLISVSPPPPHSHLMAELLNLTTSKFAFIQIAAEEALTHIAKQTPHSIESLQAMVRQSSNGSEVKAAKDALSRLGSPWHWYQNLFFWKR